MERERESKDGSCGKSTQRGPAGGVGWMDGRTGWRVMKEMKLATAARLYIVPLFPSFPFSPIYFPYQLLSLSLGYVRGEREREELNIKASTASTFTKRERERGTTPFLFLFDFSSKLPFTGVTRARREIKRTPRLETITSQLMFYLDTLAVKKRSGRTLTPPFFFSLSLKHKQTVVHTRPKIKKEIKKKLEKK